MRQVVLRPLRAGDGGGLARVWLDGAAVYAAIDPTLLQVPATEGLAEWLEHVALRPTTEAKYMQVADADGQVVGHVWATIRPPNSDAARQMLRDMDDLRHPEHSPRP
jgi:hypothetical protein